MRKAMILSLLLVVCIAPLLVAPVGDFIGTDDKAAKAIGQLAPDYHPWFSPLFEPASSEMEILLFTLQGALGAAVIFYFFSFYQGRRARDKEQKHHADHR